MISILSKIFIKDRDNTNMPNVRKAYGVICSTLGICLNVILFSAKIIAGIISGSIAILSDAFNNLFDAGSSVITIVGFRFAGHKPDSKHPYGHGRIEYISGLIVSIIVIVAGIDLGKTSIEKIIHPSDTNITVFSIIILAVSVIVKLYMALYNRKYGKKLELSSLKAISIDSLCDCVATLFVLASTLVQRFTGVNIDGYTGVLVSLFILYTGIAAARETITPLIGKPPEDDFIKQVKEIVLSHEEVIGVHDLIVHDYGLGHVMISLHCEVSSEENLIHIHNHIDEIEQELYEELNCEAIIHIDPVILGDEDVSDARQKIEKKITDIDNKLSMHDFRMIKKENHTNVIFDIEIPFELETEEDKIIDEISLYISSLNPSYVVTIKIDKIKGE